MAPAVRRPSSWWLVIGAFCAVLAITTAMTAVFIQRAATAPIGEGEVFINDAATAAEMVETAVSLDEGVRHARNALDLEAVSVVRRDGSTLATTSQSLEGTEVANPFLRFSLAEGRFAALAGPVAHDITIDEVTEWASGSILYQVVAPLSDEQALVLFYDLSELLSRRTRPGEIPPETVQLLGLSVIFALLATMVLIGHTRASRRHREMVAESDLLKAQSEELRITNRKLDEARQEAERALALAEEKTRIRSEFVLMINHELRTPLTSVVTGARLVRDGDLTEDERLQIIDSLIADGTRLQEIIDQILVVAKAENRGLDYPLRRVGISDLVAALNDIGLSEVEAESRPGRSDTLILTDPKSLALLVRSLIDNARTHGAGTVKVTLSPEPVIEPMAEVGERPDHPIYIGVADDGPGIPVEFLPRVFEKFEKSSFSSGTGLGLYMARLMVEALRGSIGLETTPKGTIFQIAIPAVPVIERVGAS